MLYDDDDDFMPPRLRRPPNSCNDRNTDVTNTTMISADDPNDDPDHADDVFQDIYRTTIPQGSGQLL